MLMHFINVQFMRVRVRGGDLATQSTQGSESVGVVWDRAEERGGGCGGGLGVVGQKWEARVL